MLTSQYFLQRGKLSDDATYELHGIGCRVYISEKCIDFDCGPDSRIDGFDSWRLYIYACEVPKKHKKHTNKTTIEREFSEYVEKGKAKKSQGSTSNLFFQKP
ncbi:DUF6896 domain-containing protein [Pseudomonas proteolytica]|uniref:DUF6896 domain-containing protein n=1 Tax=Pseudomonas proteolytica TaxID=219574 RepID=UPI003B9802A0